MKKYFLYTSILCCLFLFGCGEKKQNPETDTGTGVVDAVLTGTHDQVGEDLLKVAQGTGFSDLESEENEEELTEVAPFSQQDFLENRYAVAHCNRLLEFYQCVIDQAPIENQDIMRENLKKVTEPWDALVDTDLSEICTAISQGERFREIALHYKDQGCIDKMFCRVLGFEECEEED